MPQAKEVGLANVGSRCGPSKEVGPIERAFGIEFDLESMAAGTVTSTIEPCRRPRSFGATLMAGEDLPRGATAFAAASFAAWVLTLIAGRMMAYV